MNNKHIKNHNIEYTTTYICRYCLGTFTGHYKRVCCDDSRCITQHKEEIRVRAHKRSEQARARRKNQKSGTLDKTLCIRCHNPKGANRWYCPTCHRYLTNLYGDLTTHSPGGLKRSPNYE